MLEWVKRLFSSPRSSAARPLEFNKLTFAGMLPEFEVSSEEIEAFFSSPVWLAARQVIARTAVFHMNRLADVEISPDAIRYSQGILYMAQYFFTLRKAIKVKGSEDDEIRILQPDFSPEGMVWAPPDGFGGEDQDVRSALDECFKQE